MPEIHTLNPSELHGVVDSHKSIALCLDALALMFVTAAISTGKCASRTPLGEPTQTGYVTTCSI